MSVTPPGARVTPFEQKMVTLGLDYPSTAWYEDARGMLRGLDGGEHGLLLYNLINQGRIPVQPLILLDIGTARGFSAIIMARALHDFGLSGHVFTVDVVPHEQIQHWHVEKQDPNEPLVGKEVSRAALWSEEYAVEAEYIIPLAGKSIDILGNWDGGPIDLAFVDGDHTYETVSHELRLLRPLMAPGGMIVLDDYHTGTLITELHSRLLNRFLKVLGLVAQRARFAKGAQLAPPTDAAFSVICNRFVGVRRAITEFYIDQSSEWSLEVVPMPSRGEYQGTDYSLALLTHLGPPVSGLPSTKSLGITRQES